MHPRLGSVICDHDDSSRFFAVSRFPPVQRSSFVRSRVSNQPGTKNKPWNQLPTRPSRRRQFWFCRRIRCTVDHLKKKTRENRAIHPFSRFEPAFSSFSRSTSRSPKLTSLPKTRTVCPPPVFPFAFLVDDSFPVCFPG